MSIGSIHISQRDAIIAGSTTVVAGGGGYLAGTAVVKRSMEAAVKAAHIRAGIIGAVGGAGLALGIPALVKALD